MPRVEDRREEASSNASFSGLDSLPGFGLSDLRASDTVGLSFDKPQCETDDGRLLPKNLLHRALLSR